MRQRKLLFVFALLLGFSAPALAQVNVNVNVGGPQYRQPIYTEVADYYYLPDYGVYYNVNRKMYVYPERGRWVYARRLPARFGHHHDWRRTHFVRMHERAPFFRNDYYQNKYRRAAGNHKQYGYRQNQRQDQRYKQRNHARPQRSESYQHNKHQNNRGSRPHERGHR